MSREIIKMDGRDSTECKNWEMKGHDRYFEICFKSLKDKRSIVTCLLQKAKRKTWRGRKEEMHEVLDLIF